jgi:hypothetical protein
MGIPVNKEMASYNSIAYRFFLVCAGYMVWLGILFLHRLALGGKGKTGFY